MAVVRGTEGSIKFNSALIAEVRSYKLNQTQGSYDANTIGSGDWTKTVAGKKSWDIDVEVFYDSGDAGNSTISIGDEAEVELFVEGDTTGNERKHGTARVTDVSLNGSEDGLIEMSVKMMGVGPLNSNTIT